MRTGALIVERTRTRVTSNTHTACEHDLNRTYIQIHLTVTINPSSYFFYRRTPTLLPLWCLQLEYLNPYHGTHTSFHFMSYRLSSYHLIAWHLTSHHFFLCHFTFFHDIVNSVITVSAATSDMSAIVEKPL